MRNSLGLRLFKLFVLFGVPLLGVLYAYQFTDQDGEKSGLVPFRPFQPSDFSVSVGGEAAKLAQIPSDNAITVVNFWATWCPPCVEEFPAMIEMRRQLEKSDFRLVFVSVDDDWSKVLQFLKVNNVPYDPQSMFWDPTKKTSLAWGSKKFPETYVVRRDLWVVERIIGLQAWTRPQVISYFENLALKFKGIPPKTSMHSLLVDTFVNKSFANTSDEKTESSEKIADEPLVHEQDQKSLSLLKSNIETATQNLQNAEAAEKEELRNLEEQKIILSRREKELDEAESDLEKIQLKSKEVSQILSKTSTSMKLEEREKAKIEAQMKEIQSKIIELQKKIDQSKDELTQATKGLNTRVQSIETYEKARESSEEESSALKAKKETATQLVSDRKKEVSNARKGIRDRDEKLRDIRSQMAKAKRVLEDQKKKLNEFEQLLKK